MWVKNSGGNTVVWNQSISLNGLSETTHAGIKYTPNNDGSVTLTGGLTSGQPYSRYFLNNHNWIKGHKYYFSCNRLSDAASSTYLQVDNYTNWQNVGAKDPKIVTCLNNNNINPSLVCGDSSVNITVYPNVFDLTLMFGYDNEPSSVEEFQDWLSKNVGLAPYYAYNAGELINAKPTGMASIGYNLMDLDGTTGTARVPGKYDDGLYGSYYGIRGTYSSVSFVPAATGASETITPDGDGKFEITRPGEVIVSGAGSSTTVFMWYDGSYTEDSVEYERNEYGGLDVTKIYGKANGSST